MTNFKKLAAYVAALALVTAGSLAVAQDDLDDLLKDLEGDAPAAAETKPTAGSEDAASAPKADDAAKAADVADGEQPAEKEDASPAEEKPSEVESAESAEESQPANAPAAEVKEDAAAEEQAEEPAAEEKVEESPAAEAEGEDEQSSAEAAAEESEPAEKAEEPAAEEKAEETVAEEKAEEKAEPTAEAQAAKVDEVLNLLDELDPVEKTSEKPVEKKIAEKAPEALKPALGPDAELLANIRATEELRRRAYDEQAKREISEARAAMNDMEYSDAARHYGVALKLLNDSPASKKLRRECEQGVAEGLYRAAIQEDRTGRRERAIKLIEKAIDMRHPKARKQLEFWLAEGKRGTEKTDVSSISHRKNDSDFIEQRKADQKLLRRARQLLSVRDIDAALEQCEIVLAAEPYNQEALRLRKQIIKKQQLILDQERETSRDGMIAEVGKKWRPVYAPNAKKLGEVISSTQKKPLGDDPERSVEQDVINRMKGMRLPAISFKPPATIIDAIEFFRGASKDYDNPNLPLEQRGFNFILKTSDPLVNKASEEAADDDSFSATAEDDAQASAANPGVPVIPTIMVNDVTLYDALKYVCDSVNYKFKIQGKVIMVMQKDMTIDEMVTRSYPVLGSFIERMGSASSDMKEMKSAGFGGGNKKDDGGDENQEKDWKAFFEMMGVQWPEGSTIMYIKTIGKLRVKNTYENLAELEKALTELNVDQKLVEIEARFVEVCQEDLNSLGFEWILNSDYALGSKALASWAGLKDGTWSSSTTSTLTPSSSSTELTVRPVGGVNTMGEQVLLENTTVNQGQTYTKWTSSRGSGNQLGINAMGGTDAVYGNGNRFLSTKGNHISGEGGSVNDQFMRVNAFLGSADLSMILHMLSQRSDTDLLSAPKVLTKPGEEAVIKVVTEYIYPTDYDVQLQSSGSSGSSGSSSSGGSSMILAVVEPQSFTMREVGVILDVTPTLTDDGNLIDLKLNTQVVDEPTWKNYGMKIPFSGNTSLSSFEGIGEIFTGLGEVLSSIGEDVSKPLKEVFAEKAVNSASAAMDNLSDNSNKNIEYYDAPMEQPFFHVRSIDSSISINPGSTIVMGGLITEERKAMDDKVPFLGDIPLIGRLFRSHSEWTNKRNLLIFVTTRLVDVRGREVTLGSVETSDKAEVKSAPSAE